MDSDGLSDLVVTISEVGEAGIPATCCLERFPLLLPVADWEHLIAVRDTAVVEEKLSRIASGTTTESREVSEDDSSLSA